MALAVRSTAAYARPVAPRQLIVRRTSEHWWEDEEEFDALTELVLPKTLHLVVLGPGGDGWGAAGEAEAGAMRGAILAAGFASPQGKALADPLWAALGQAGPPFFKKIRTREPLATLEDPSASAAAVMAAAEAVWSELLGQTFRPELDYGLAGAALEPRDELLVCLRSGLAASRLLAHAGLTAGAEAQARGYAPVAVPGYKAAERGGPLRNWRELGARMAAAAAAEAVGAQP
ncbi:hypothetical protein HYH03_002581 [Edaphochlamys debaryana]|uniref:Uncharacterized protein n=1 Tax=Edaphochlamys debaryana TaxID=47281 RepID=A0A835YDJ5_9CHLO|nr:hypothetical protein HYH03_002581 [Edaphochlamys debaryana]|eukprot:KAG2499642.1 hypothetical protein HYH03_002581 [Edaphochlamys debaryana]